MKCMRCKGARWRVVLGVALLLLVVAWPRPVRAADGGGITLSFRIEEESGGGSGSSGGSGGGSGGSSAARSGNAPDWLVTIGDGEVALAGGATVVIGDEEVPLGAVVESDNAQTGDAFALEGAVCAALVAAGVAMLAAPRRERSN